MSDTPFGFSVPEDPDDRSGRSEGSDDRLRGAANGPGAGDDPREDGTGGSSGDDAADGTSSGHGPGDAGGSGTSDGGTGSSGTGSGGGTGSSGTGSSGGGTGSSGDGGAGPTGGFPFGFSVGGAGSGGPAGGDPQNPFGGMGFDPAQLGQMLSQFGQMLSGMGAAATSGTPSGSGVDYSVAKSLARRQMGSFTPVSSGQRDAVRDSARLAEVWLDDVTSLPAGASRTDAWTPVDWVDNTIDTWKRLCDPVASQVNGMWADALPEEARALAGPMMGMFSQIGGMAFGSQLGQALGQLSQEVLTSTDIGLPLGPQGVGALLPEAVEKFGEGLEQPSSAVLVFLAAREAAHQRLYEHVPWLRQRVLAAVEDYARGITMDFSSIENLAQGIDPSSLTDPSKLQEILQQGALEPKNTPEQQQALVRLETLLALVEGWVETVVTRALGDRIPGAAALTETMRRRRASGGPAEQTFATLVGLELRPRKVREAAALWHTLTESAGVQARDTVWSHPDLLPDSSDLDSPAGFVDRVLGGDTGVFDDPIAQLQATVEKERSEREQRDAGDGASDTGRDGDSRDGGSRDGDSRDGDDRPDTGDGSGPRDL